MCPAENLSPEVAMHEFREREPRSAVPRNLALLLWQYWRAECPDRSLLDDAEEDLALLLHAQAHGAWIPRAGERNYHGRLLADHKQLFAPPPPEPSSLAWGPRANLAPEAGAAMDSPIMDAWVFEDGQSLGKVLIIGQGLPAIREQVLADAFMASLRVGCLDTDMVNIGVIQVERPTDQREANPLPFNPLGGAAGALAGEGSREALQELAGVLAKLANSTGLVRLHKLPLQRHVQMDEEIRRRAERRPNDPPVVWALAAPSSADEADVVGLVPYLEIPEPATTLLLPLSASLLESDWYRRLEELHRRVTFKRAEFDLGARVNYHRKEIERLEGDSKAYFDTPKESRDEIWGSTVELTVEYDFEADRAIQLPFPVYVRAEEFYRDHVPAQIKEHERWKERLSGYLANLLDADASPEAPVRRLVSGYFLDAAIRDRRPHGNPALTSAFEAWSAQVQPMLWFEWRRLLRERGIELADVFTRHTVCHTWHGALDDTGPGLFIAPFTIVDRLRSVALFDNRRHVVVVRAPIDDATQDAEATPSPDRTPPTSPGSRAWDKLVKLADKPATDDERFGEALLEELRAEPTTIVRQVLDALSGARGPAADVAGLQRNLDAALAETRVPRALRHAVAALAKESYQTARWHLAKAADATGELGARVALMQAVVEFQAAGESASESASESAEELERTHKLFSRGERSVRLGQAFYRALGRAERCDKRFTDNWIVRLKSVKFELAGGILLQNLPKSEKQKEGFSDDEHAALIARTGVEAARLAAQLEQAARRLSNDGEPIELAFAKLGLALEDVFLAELAGGSRPTATDLFAILTGRKPPTYKEA